MSGREDEGAAKAQQLIGRSVSHNEIAHAEWTAELAEALSLKSEGGADSAAVAEYWGTTESGNEWRIHLDRAKGEV